MSVLYAFDCYFNIFLILNSQKRLSIMGKPVILTHFDSLLDQEGADQGLIYYNNSNLFDVARNKKHLKQILLDKILNPKSNNTNIKRIFDYFDEHISFINGSAAQKTLNILRRFS